MLHAVEDLDQEDAFAPEPDVATGDAPPAPETPTATGLADGESAPERTTDGSTKKFTVTLDEDQRGVVLTLTDISAFDIVDVTTTPPGPQVNATWVPAPGDPTATALTIYSHQPGIAVDVVVTVS